MNGFLSEHQAGNRRFTLYLPPSYSPNSRRFPAVYVQDGSSLFQDQFELLDSTFQKRRLPELVLIGIESENRLDEYTPWPAASLNDRFPDFGGMGYDYLSDITNRFIPFYRRKLERHQRTAIKRNDRRLIRRPYLHVRLIKVSVSVWKNRLYFRFILVRKRSGSHSFIFL